MSWCFMYIPLYILIIVMWIALQLLKSNMLVLSIIPILSKALTGVFPISIFLAKSLVNKNFRNCRTTNYIDKKHVAVTKSDNKNMTASKKWQ